MQVDFYHLTSPLDRVLPRIAERVVQTGGRLLIVAEPEEQRIAIDRLLWSYAPESFLPHAQVGSNDDTAQPILIAQEVTEVAPANAEPGTIRKELAESIEANSVHGSDSDENAEIEIAYFFKPEEIVG